MRIKISIELDETFEFPSPIESSSEFTELIFREDIKQILRNMNEKSKKYPIRFCWQKNQMLK